MLHVGLLILKILGILILGILGLAVFLLCLILFLPVRYRLDMERNGAFCIDGRVSWLFWIFSAEFHIGWENDEEGFQKNVKICIFGISMDRLKKWRQKRKKKKAEEKKRESSQPEKIPEVTKTEPEKEPEAPASEEKQEQKKAEDLPAVREAPREKKEKRRRKQRNPIETFRHICDRIKNIGSSVRSLYRKKNDLVEFWNREEHVRARQALLKEAGYLWKKSRPRKAKGEVFYGFEDPSWTGLFTGILSILYVWYPETVSLHPDFEQAVLKGEFHIRGRIQVYPFCLTAFRLWRNQDVRRMYQEWRQ